MLKIYHRQAGSGLEWFEDPLALEEKMEEDLGNP